MRLARFAVIAGLLGSLSQPAQAQVGNFKFLSGSGVSAFGVSVGTYKAQLDGANIDVWCVDFLNQVGAGNQYQVNITSLGGSPNLSKTRFGSLANQPRQYRQAVWLASQFSTQGNSNWGSIQAAIWHLMTPGVPSVNAATQGQVNYWLVQAATNYGSYYYHNAYVLTDVAVERCSTAQPGGAPWNGCGRQEHIFIDGALTVTPEPATMALLATGLVGLGGAGYLRRRRERRGTD